MVFLRCVQLDCNFLSLTLAEAVKDLLQWQMENMRKRATVACAPIVQAMIMMMMMMAMTTTEIDGIVLTIGAVGNT